MTGIPCPVCAADTADGLACQRCTVHLRRDIESIARMWPQLDITLSRQGRTGSGGKRNEPSPLPLHAGALKVASYVRNQLSGWVRELDMGDVGDLPDQPVAWCLWLAARTERMRAHAAVDEIADEMRYCGTLIRQVIDLPAEKTFLGGCATCGADLYARPGATETVCQACERAGVTTAPVAVQERRAEMLDRLGHQWATVGTCALVLGVVGLTVKADTVQNWARARQIDGRTVPARLHPRGHDSAGHALYRVGDVADLATESAKRHAERRTRLDKPDAVTDHVSQSDGSVPRA